MIIHIVLDFRFAKLQSRGATEAVGFGDHAAQESPDLLTFSDQLITLLG